MPRFVKVSGYIGMIFPVVLLRDSQGTLEQVLLLPVVAQVVNMHCSDLSKSLATSG